MTAQVSPSSPVTWGKDKMDMRLFHKSGGEGKGGPRCRPVFKSTPPGAQNHRTNSEEENVTGTVLKFNFTTQNMVYKRFLETCREDGVCWSETLP